MCWCRRIHLALLRLLSTSPRLHLAALYYYRYVSEFYVFFEHVGHAGMKPPKVGLDYAGVFSLLSLTAELGTSI